MSNSTERYKELGLIDSLSRIYRYPTICEELRLIFIHVYSKVSKDLQRIICQDTLTTIQFLSEVQTPSAVSAAHLLLKSTEKILPKQKRHLVIKEYKHAMVMQKRRSKAQQLNIGCDELPPDILVHIFSFLDMPSLVSAGLVSWSWNLAASDNLLWKCLYSTIVSNYDEFSNIKAPNGRRQIKNDPKLFEEDTDSQSNVDWREASKNTYGGMSPRSREMLKYEQGYCYNCKRIVWLANMKCSNKFCCLKAQNLQISVVSPRQVAEYVLNNDLSTKASSDNDSDSESEEVFMWRMWAYPRQTPQM